MEEEGGWRQVAGGGSLCPVSCPAHVGDWRQQVGGWRQVRWEAAVWGGGSVGVAGGGMLRYSAVRTGSIGSVRGHRISDTNGSVSDAQRYAIKVVLKQPWFRPDGFTVRIQTLF